MFDARRSGGWTVRRLIPYALLALVAGAPDAWAASDPWSVSVYIGPASTKYFGAVFSSGRLQSSAAMVGFALDGRLLYLGEGVSLAAETQATQYFAGHSNTSFAFEFGFQVNEPFGFRRSAFSVYDGPSYALDPPYTSIGYHSIVYTSDRKKFLNCISLEYAVELPGTRSWDAVGRLYHRSGAWGLYSIGDDDGLSVGLGLRYRF